MNDISNLSNQEIFDQVYLGLASQGFERSIDTLGCVYRSADGKKCAIGWLIKDSDYDQSIENRTVYSKQVRNALKFKDYQSAFLRELQGIHDDLSPTESLKDELHIFAVNHDLTIPSVNSIPAQQTEN